MNATFRITRRRGLSALAGTLLAAALCQGAAAQTFPSKPITLMVPFPPGGVTDQVARTVATKLQEAIGQTVVVDNRPGAGGQIAAAATKQAPADGHTLYVGATEMFAINQVLFRKFSYDTLRDFQPVAALVQTPMVLVVPKNSPANSVQDLVDLAKKKTSGVTYASQGIGSIGHMLGQLMAVRTGANLVHVPYKGSAPGLQDLMSNQVDMMFDVNITAAPLIQGDKLKALAVAVPERMSTLPDVPTTREAGLPDVQASVWFGVVAKKGTPDNVIQVLNTEINKVLKNPEVVKRFADQGLTPVTMTPDQFGNFLKTEINRWGPLVKASGASVD
jgi:tripartite-type tricarboxylate transporter receptor subunit TctC